MQCGRRAARAIQPLPRPVAPPNGGWPLSWFRDQADRQRFHRAQRRLSVEARTEYPPPAAPTAPTRVRPANDGRWRWCAVTGKELCGQRGYAEHLAEFLNAVRRRTPTRASAETAHRSCALVHLAEIAFRTRGRLDFAPRTEQFVDCEEANQMLTKQYREPFGLPEVSSPGRKPS